MQCSAMSENILTEKALQKNKIYSQKVIRLGCVGDWWHMLNVLHFPAYIPSPNYNHSLGLRLKPMCSLTWYGIL